MQSLSDIRHLLAERGLAPRHRLGQNFLHDQNLLRKLIDAAGVSPGDLALEVGPGTGTLTEALIERGAEVVACEIDPGLASIIADRLGDRATLIVGDALDKGGRLNPSVIAALAGRPFTLIANLPYQIASPLIAGILMDGQPSPEGSAVSCTGLYVTIQKEVADRLIAKPGTKDFGPLTIIAGALAEIRRIAALPPSAFWPQPKVTSAMLAITPKDKPLTGRPREFARFITMLFSKRRKQIGTILGRDARLPEAVTHQQRPESLSIDQLVALHEAIDREGRADGTADERR